MIHPSSVFIQQVSPPLTERESLIHSVRTLKALPTWRTSTFRRATLNLASIKDASKLQLCTERRKTFEICLTTTSSWSARISRSCHTRASARLHNKEAHSAHTHNCNTTTTARSPSCLYVLPSFIHFLRSSEIWCSFQSEFHNQASDVRPKVTCPQSLAVCCQATERPFPKLSLLRVAPHGNLPEAFPALSLHPRPPTPQ